MNTTPMTAKEAFATARSIAYMVNIGKLSYEEGKIRCAEFLAIVNAKGHEVAKKYKKKYYPISFAGLRR